MKKILNYFTIFEWCLWIGTMAAVVIAYAVFDRGNPLTLVGSLMGITSILFNAKGNPVGQGIMLAFCVVYGYISWGYHYYGEVITYVFMTGPMDLFAFIAWLRNPFKGKKTEVTVNKVKNKELGLLAVLTVIITVVFYFILKKFGTSNFMVSTFSIATSFAAVYLTARRDYRFSMAYAFNDIVLIILWALAARDNITYLSMVICFCSFLCMDCYTYFSWQRLKKKQAEG